MTRLFVIFCAFIVLGSFLAYQIQQGSGYILLVWGNTSVEMSLWFALAVILVASFLIYLGLFLLGSGVKGVRSAKRKISGYSSDKAQKQTVAGLIAFIEGDWLPAQKKLTRAAKNVSSPIINYLAAARCAYEMDKEQEALQLLHHAENSVDNSGLAVALTQARMQLASQHYEQALATLARAEEISPQHNVVLSLQQQVYVALKDWDALKQLLPKLHQRNIGSVKQRYALEQMLYQQWFAQSLDKAASFQQDERLQALEQSWASIPSHFQQEESTLTTYARELINLKQYDTAEAVLIKGLSQKWCNDWVEMYGLLVTSAPERALKKAEKWLKAESNNPVLLLTLGRLCLQNKQWGRAKDFFSQSISLQARAETYAELARLQYFLGADSDSQESNRQGLLHSINTLVEVPELHHKKAAL